MTKKRKIIRGAGGGPKTPPPPYRAPDTLHSRQFVTLQDLISEGEIEGFATPSSKGITDRTSDAYNNAAKADVFLNDTPLLNVDTTLSNSDFLTSVTNPDSSEFNFQDVTLRTAFGTDPQDR